MPRRRSRDQREWERTTLAETTKRLPERAAFTTTYGAPLPPIAPPEGDRHDLPGEPPYTRGIHPTGHRGRLWTMRQYAGMADAEATNERYRYLLASGQTGLSVAFDLPTQMGYDADDPRVSGEVGRVGVSISSLADMERLLEGIPLGEVTTSMTINATAPILLAMYVALARKQGVPLEKVGGTTQNDILKEYIARGTWIYPPGPSMRLAGDLIAWCAARLPKWNPISISGYHIREAGADAVQELAFTFANAIAYVDAVVARGLRVDAFARRLSFFFAAHSTLVEEVAKFRAARRVWHRIATERYGATEPASAQLRFHTQTMGSTLTAQQPLNNIVRTAIEGLAAVLGGTQSLHTNAFDEALGLPTEESARIALRTQQIIAEESGAAETVDPLAGSYLVERLTDEIERRTLEEIARIDGLGGALAGIERAYQQEAIEASAYEHQRKVEAKERIVVGVNAYRSGEEVVPPIQKVDERLVQRARDRLREMRARRDAAAAGRAREALRRGAAGSEDLFPLVLAAVEAEVTLGEISDDLRGVFGTHRPRP
ncbi:MAG: methylmalonyl-CoA mutase [Chloroflexi bacterium]|nr:methylmalonyl-CoA mutase [Chloroflexota bacterium]